MCVDFKYLNKAYPKDGYPLPEIDWKVKSLCGYPFKCFLDAYKRYHRIKMDKEDEEKTAFITSQGIFFYSKIPFGLKNARPTYQRLVDKAFQKKIGKNLEVYVDDLVIKSRTKYKIMRDNEETFKTLRSVYGHGGGRQHMDDSSLRIPHERNTSYGKEKGKGHTMEVKMICSLEINLDLLEERREQSAIYEAKSKAKMEKYYNSKVCNTSFKPRDLVYMNNDASHAKDSGKLSPKWEGLYEVTEALGSKAYKLRDHNEKSPSANLKCPQPQKMLCA
nr:reverse transcriptase domain-containing protein [Tanacetum cinerariifolium]